MRKLTGIGTWLDEPIPAEHACDNRRFVDALL
jgi:hypothetical protein